MKVSVLIPTRHRVERLRTLLESYDATTDGEDCELVFRVDEDDVETRTFLLDYDHVIVVGPRHQGYGSMPLFFNEAARRARGDLLMCGNDDMIFRTFDWPNTLAEAAESFRDGIFNLGVMTLNEMHFPFSTVSRRAVERLGFIWDPRIFWGDIYLRDVMAFFGRALLVPSVTIDHDWAGFRPDKVFNETRESKSQVEGDAAYWSGPHRLAVDEAIEKLKELRA